MNDAKNSHVGHVVTLTWVELALATRIGVGRRVQRLQTPERKDRYGLEDDDGWTLDIEGAAGEMAVAKLANIYWNGNMGNLKAADVGRLQVRTRSRDYYDLILHPTDPDDSAFILVVGKAPRFRIVGWIVARDGKLQKWWKDPAGNRPAFFVPQSELIQFDVLREKMQHDQVHLQ